MPVNKPKAIVVGAGKWAQEYWSVFLTDQDLIDVAGVVDLDRRRAVQLAGLLGTAHASSDLDETLKEVPDAAIAVILTSPEAHAENIIEAHRHGLDVITEKPLCMTAGELERVKALPREFRAVVTQNYRYEAFIQTMKTRLDSGELGPVRSIHARFAADYRVPGSWDVGDAHGMPDPMLTEGSIHHLDMMRYLTGSDIESLAVTSTNPEGSSFAGDALAAAVLRFATGVIGTYEASLLCAGRENRWHHEYYRVECRDGSIEFDGWNLTEYRGNAVTRIDPAGDPTARPGHLKVLRDLIDWRETGRPGATSLRDNIKSMSAVISAVEAARTGKWQHVG